MKTCRFARVVLTALLACGTGPRVYADGLVQQFSSLFFGSGLELDSKVHTAHFASGSAVLLFQLNEAQQRSGCGGFSGGFRRTRLDVSL